MKTLVFLSGKRTPFGSNGGSLKDVGPVALGLHASQGALQQSGVRADQIDHVIYSNVLASSADAIYIPRHIGLKLGIPENIPALGINRLCGSGFQVIVEAFQQMQTGDTEVALVGGVENMSMTPYLLRNARWGMKMGNQVATDMLMESLTDLHVNAPMAITAENLASRYKISREESDAFALKSQRLYAAALEKGIFKDEIVGYEMTDRKGNKTVLSHDEHARPETTTQVLAKLKPVFKKDGVVTAANASGIVDGAAAMVVCTEDRAKKEGWKPLGKLISYGIAGCNPSEMGIGPVPATHIALKRAGMDLSQMDIIEVNEAFAPQTLAVQKELGIDGERLNVNGGAIALGHPLAASGTRIMTHLFYELKRRKARYGLGTACIGGGQGIAMIVEAME